MSGNLLVVSAASGAGKTSLVNALVAADDQVALSVSHTTREPRPGEVDGQHYHFVDTDRFAQMVQTRAFLEHATVFGRSYGTSEAMVQAQRDKGMDVLLEIDWQGARQVRERVADAISIFIVPPSIEALRSRLTGRGQDSEEIISSRMAKARDEMRHYDEFDYLIVNDDFDEALVELRQLVSSLRLRMACQAARYRSLLDDLT